MDMVGFNTRRFIIIALFIVLNMTFLDSFKWAAFKHSNAVCTISRIFKTRLDQYNNKNDRSPRFDAPNNRNKPSNGNTRSTASPPAKLKDDFLAELFPKPSNLKMTTATDRVRIDRPHSQENRVPFSALHTGQKLRGRIITVADFGLFVDVGTKKDGLVHIRDISKDYFVENLVNRFIPGVSAS